MPTTDIRAFDWQHEWVHGILTALDTSLAALGEAITSGEYPGDGLHGRESWEHSTGVALVTLQVYLSEGSAVASIFGGGPHQALLRDHGAPIDGYCFTDVEVFWHLANFFKHREEWGRRELQARDRRWWPNNPTANALRALNLSEETEFPLIIGVGLVLGEEWEHLIDMLGPVEQWRERCLAALDATLVFPDELSDE